MLSATLLRYLCALLFKNSLQREELKQKEAEGVKVRDRKTSFCPHYEKL